MLTRHLMPMDRRAVLRAGGSLLMVSAAVHPSGLWAQGQTPARVSRTVAAPPDVQTVSIDCLPRFGNLGSVEKDSMTR